MRRGDRFRRLRDLDIVDRPSEEQIAAWYPRLFRTALRLTGNREDSADLTQQAFCKALGRWEQFDGNCLATTWLHGILVNCVRDRLRRHARWPVKDMDKCALAETASGEDGVPERLGRQEQLSRLRQAIEALDGELRRPLVAAVIDGYTYAEVAQMLSIPAGTVAYRVHRARRQLRAAMLESFPEA